MRTLKWLRGNFITHSHSLDWLLFKVSQRTRKTSIITFDKKYVSQRLSSFKFPYCWSKEKCTYNWSIWIVSWGVCGGHGGSTLLWVPWWLATHGRYKTNAVNKCYHGHGSKGGRQGRAPPPGGPNSFIFMQFSSKIWKIIAILGVGAPPWGKSWIRHWWGLM